MRRFVLGVLATRARAQDGQLAVRVRRTDLQVLSQALKLDLDDLEEQAAAFTTIQ